MKRNLLFAVAALATTFSIQSCDPPLEDVAFKTREYAIDLQVPPSPAGASEQTTTATQELNLDELIQGETKYLTAENIDKINIKTVRVELDNADSSSNLANFTSMKMTIQPANGGQSVSAAESSIDDVFASSLALEESKVNQSANLNDYRQGNQFTYTMAFNLRRPTVTELKGRVLVSYNFSLKARK